MSFPYFGQLPAHLVLQTVKKLEFREASRLRQTCRDLDELVHSNAARLKFPVVGKDLTVYFCEQDRWIEIDRHPDIIFPDGFVSKFPYKDYSRTCETLIHVSDTSFIDKCCLPANVQHNLDRLQCAVFDNMIFKFTRGLPSVIPKVPKFIELIQESNIRCRCLKFPSGIHPVVNLEELYAISGAAAIVTEMIFTDIDYTMERLEQIVSMGCKDLSLPFCEEFPPECHHNPSTYLNILSRFESLNIGRMRGRTQLSLAPIIQMMMTASPEMSLRHLAFPFSSHYLTKEELADCDLEKWRFDTQKYTNDFASHFDFIIETPNDFVIVMRGKNTRICIFERHSKRKIDEFLMKWSELFLGVKFLRIPLDISGLYDEIEGNHGFERIKEYMMKLVKNVYSYKPYPYSG